MRTIGIITIHKINNYGSVLQAYALQKACEDLGYKVEIIDYDFPNEFHADNPYAITGVDNSVNEPRWIKMLFALALKKQHKGIAAFVRKYQHLSSGRYQSPDLISRTPPIYDVYITGSDQLWSPRHCNGDPTFMLNFAPDGSKKISYAASFGTNSIPPELRNRYQHYLSRYTAISVRENSGAELVHSLISKQADIVLDPTLLLNGQQWNLIAYPHRVIEKKYILCYFLNYSFNAFPYADELADYIQKCTGYEIVRVARPPHRLNCSHTTYKIGASPEDFLALVRDAEIVLTTSFHGTAFAVNYGRPVFSIVKNKGASDSRQSSLLHNLGLSQQIIEIETPFPVPEASIYDVASEQKILEALRKKSMAYLANALKYE